MKQQVDTVLCISVHCLLLLRTSYFGHLVFAALIDSTLIVETPVGRGTQIFQLSKHHH